MTPSSQPANQLTNQPANQPSIPPPPPPRRLRIVQALTIVAILASLAAAFYFRDRIQELRPFGYAAVFLAGLISNATLIFPVPGLAVTAVMGGVFNPWLVGLAGGVGQALGELTGYMAGYSGQTWIDDNPTYNRLTRWMQRYGIWTIFVLALIPNPVFDVGGMAAGALRFPLWKFLVSCGAGKVLKNVIIALAAYYGIEALLRLFGG